MRKVLIVNAPSRASVYGALAPLTSVEIPVWAGILADYLESYGYPTQVLDAEVEGLSVAETAQRITAASPDLVVFSIYGQQPSASTQCLPAAEAVARLLPDVHTLALGTHPSALPYRTLQEGPWSYVAQGEGHRTVHGLLLAMSGLSRIEHVPGLWWRDPEEGCRIVTNAPVQLNSHLAVELAGRGYSRFDFAKYRAHNWHAFGYPDRRSPYASLQTSLGCPFRCTFCCINAPFGEASIRFWSPENVLSQFIALAERGVVNVKIPDEMFLLNPRHVEAICDALIKLESWKFNLWAYARVDTLKDEQLLRKLKRAGFNWLAVGIESGSAHVRHGVEKGKFGQDDIRDAVGRALDSDIAVVGNYIFGLPDDTRATMQETLDLACDLNTEWANFYCAMAYPGSALYQQAKRAGWALPDDVGGPGWIGYSQHAYETLPLPTDTLSAAEVLDFRDRAFMTYYTRAAYQSMLLNKFGPDEVVQILRMLSYGKPKRKLLEGATV